MNNEQFRRHLTNVSIEDQNKQIIFEYDDKEKLLAILAIKKLKSIVIGLLGKSILLLALLNNLKNT